MSVTPDEIPPGGMRALISAYADHMANHANSRTHLQAVREIGSAAHEARGWCQCAGDLPGAEFWGALAMIAGDQTRPERLTDAETLRMIAQAAGNPEPHAGTEILRDALPGAYLP